MSYRPSVQAASPSDPYSWIECIECNTSTPRGFLTGGRCKRCFALYCGEAQAAPALSTAEKVAIASNAKRVLRNIGSNLGTGWAQALREREEAGEKLTQYQREAWRKVIRIDVVQGDEA